MEMPLTVLLFGNIVKFRIVTILKFKMLFTAFFYGAH